MWTTARPDVMQIQLLSGRALLLGKCVMNEKLQAEGLAGLGPSRPLDRARTVCPLSSSLIDRVVIATCW